MNLNNKGISVAQGFWVAFGSISAVMIGLFWRSFIPGYVHFSNDGPLGAQMVAWLNMPEAFTGSWLDTNTVGTSLGSYPLSITAFVRWMLGAIGFSKFFIPIALIILGAGAWCFFRQIGLRVATATIAALAVALNSSFLTSACWGVGSQEICYAMIFLALALLVSASRAPTATARWSRIALAGMCVGMGVMEGSDIGAIFSLLTAAYILFETFFNSEIEGVKPKLQGMIRLAVVAGMAAFLSAQTVYGLIGFAIKGVAVVESEEQTPEQKWSFATQWSLPKAETLGIVAPGLFGYRLDSPGGENYWGMIGSDLSWDRYLADDGKGSPPQGTTRFSGNNYYVGILVLLIGGWSVAQALRKQNSAFATPERRRILFWAVVAAIALLLSWGRFAPFYKLIHALPYFSTIRNPTKYQFVMSFAVTILFAYGLKGLWTRHVAVPSAISGGLGARINRWWAALTGADRNWAVGCLAALALAVVGALLYTSSRTRLEDHLKLVGFPGPFGKIIASFSIQEAWVAVALFTVAVGLLFLVLSGGFAGRRSRWFALVLGAFTVFDLGRADLPFIVHWNYREKYDLNLKNPVLEFLGDRPYEHRMAALPFPLPEQLDPALLSQLNLMQEVYRIEWAQHHFLYHNIQSIDVIQMPRMPAEMMAFEKAWSSRGVAGLLRRWELTNTRYLLGPGFFAELLNNQVDREQRRFSVKLPFVMALKPGVKGYSKPADATAYASSNGPCAILEFSGALPRAKLYSNWVVNTNSTETLATLFSAAFDPHRTVLVANADVKPAASTNELAGTVEYKSYQPKRIEFSADVKTHAILLLNDRHDANWQVSVDGKPAPLLRCNFLMRGVELAPGQHTVEFNFRPTLDWLYVSLAGLGVAALLIGIVTWTRREPADAEPAKRT